MCLGIPGQITSIYENHGTKMAKVDFGGIIRDVCIEVIPEAKPGDWTIVHAGFALNLLSSEEAEETLTMLDQLAEFNDVKDSKHAE